MKTDKMSFPYPVLGHNDDILPLPNLKAAISRSQDDDDYIYSFAYDWNNADIQNLIEQNLAEFICEVKCVSTMFRQSFRPENFKKAEFKIKLLKTSISGRVEFETYIVAKGRIEAYKNSSAHPDYKDEAPTEIEKGEILGILGKFSDDIDIVYTRLRAVGDFLTIKPSVNEEEQFTHYSLENTKVIVYVPQEMYTQISHYGNANSQALISSIALSGLAYALQKYEQKEIQPRWMRALYNKIMKDETLKEYRLNLDDGSTFPFAEDAFIMAQKILGNPFKELVNTFSENNN